MKYILVIKIISKKIISIFIYESRYKKEESIEFENQNKIDPICKKS